MADECSAGADGDGLPPCPALKSAGDQIGVSVSVEAGTPPKIIAIAHKPFGNPGNNHSRTTSRFAIRPPPLRGPGRADSLPGCTHPDIADEICRPGKLNQESTMTR